MRFYNRQHRHYCGMDLHVKTMYVCIVDAAGQVLVRRNMKSTPEAFLEVVAPYRDDLVVSAECMFTWCPATMRSTRDLLRRRLHLVRKRRQLLAHIQNTLAPYNLPEFQRRLADPANREGVPDHFPDPSVRKTIEVDLALLEQYDILINHLELTLVREAKRHDAEAFHRLQSVPGIGNVLALTLPILAHKIGRAVFYLLSRDTVFSLEKFMAA